MTETATNPIEIHFSPTIENQPVSISITAEAPGHQQLLANQKPGADVIKLNRGQFTVSGGMPVVLPSGMGAVTFAADGRESLGIYPDAAAVMAALGAGAELALTLPARANTHYALLRWNYDLSSTASGTMALGPAAKVTCSSDAGLNGLHAVTREIPDGPGTLDILTNLVQSFRVPRQIQNLDSLQPGTWIITETNSSFNIGVDATYGYDLTWVRQITGGTLVGDIGLRVQAGLEAQLGYHATGKYTIVLSRGLSGPEQQQIRLQLYQFRGHSWDFGFQGGVTVIPTQSALPQDCNDLLRGILGIHGTQIMKGLLAFEEWTNPQSPLFGPLLNLTNEAASQIVRNVTGIADLTTGFTEAKSRLTNLFALWNQLPQQATSLLWSKLPDQPQIQKIASFAGQISSLSGGNLDSFLQTELSKVGFLKSPAGLFLESIATPGILGVLGNAPGLQPLSTLAGTASSILNNANLLGVLQRLQAEINQRLDIQQIEQAVNSADLSKLDAWMAKRLEAFFNDHAPVTVEKLQKLRQQLQKIVGLKDKLYAKALDALKHQYNFELTASCQNAASNSALIDLVFDFAVEPVGATRGLTLALDGQFDKVLLDSTTTGVFVKQGILTHAIRRQSSVHVALPFFDHTRTHVTDALATLNAVERTDGRLILYSGKSSDLVEVKNQSQSTLSIGLVAAHKLAPGVAIHSQPQATYAYSLPMALKQLTRAGLKHWLAPELERYFPNVFCAAPSKGTFDHWLDHLVGTDSNQIGNALLSLDVSLPPEYVLAWLKAPGKKNAQQYKIMSVVLQSKFREFLLQQFFADADRYADVADGSAVFDLLVFASIPRATSIAPDRNSQSVRFPANSGNEIYWDYEDTYLRRGVLAHPATVDVLAARLQTVRETLEADGKTGLADYYADDQISRMIASAQVSRPISSLFCVEAKIVELARSAALSLAQFQASEFSNPAAARTALAEFGAKVTSTFNSHLETYATGDMLLPLGTLLFAEAAKAFDPALGTSQTQAMFSLMVVNTTPFPPAGFPHHAAVAPEDVLIETRLVR